MYAKLVNGLSVRRKLAFLALLSSGTALLAAAALFIAYQVTVCRAELVHDVETVAALVAEDARGAVPAGDPLVGQKALGLVRADRHILAAALYGRDGRLVAHHLQDGFGGGVPARAGPVGTRFDLKHVLLVRPIMKGGEQSGSIYVEASLERMYQRLFHQIIIGVLVMFGAFLVAWVVSRRVQSEILRPLRRLTHGVRQLAQGRRYVLEQEGGCRDELGLLFSAFEDMQEEIRQRDAALRRSEQYYRSLIENASDVILLLDRDGIIRHASPSASRLLSYQASELTGRQLIALVHEQDRVAVQEVFSQTLRDSGGSHTLEFRCEGNEGAWRVLEGRGSNLLADPAVGCIVVNCRDITQRKAAELALRDSESRFRHVVEHAGDAFFLHDITGRILDVNQQACDSLGYTRDELLALTVPDVESSIGPGPITAKWKAMAPGRPITVTGLHRRKDGSTFPVDVRVGLFEAGGGTLMVALARDMTERERVEAELKEAKEAAEAAGRAKSRFLANISHEIRTPMNAVLGMTQLLEHTTLTRDQRHYVEIIRNSDEALVKIIDDILHVSAIEWGRLVFQQEDFDLPDVVEGAMDMVAQRAHSKRLELVCLVEPGAPTRLRGDPNRLRQVLLNLLGNAIDFTERGEVTVRVGLAGESRAGARLDFTVADTGTGIDPGFLPQVFQPFVQGDSSTKRRHGGTGLGLAICRSLVERMGGTITVETQLGHGTTFRFDARFEKQNGDVVALWPRLKGLRILIVDDNTAARACLAETLSAWGAVTAEAGGGAGALEMLQREVEAGKPYQAALVDAEMPGMDGLTLCRAIASEASLSGVALILLWPLNLPLDPERQKGAGVLARLSKPVKQAELGRALTAVAGGRPVPVQARQLVAPPGSAVGLSGWYYPGKGSRILVAEDNPVNQEVMLLMLEQMGFTVDTVGDGRAALKALEGRTYDLVLMDCQMPEMDGYEATAAIRRLEQATGRPRSPIIAVTAHAMDGDREQCLAVGMDDCLFKPVTEGDVRAAVERWSEVPEGEAGQLDPAVWEELERVQDRGIPGYISRLSSLFLEDSPKRLCAMRAALAAGDGQELARQAHALKGGCRQLGARRLEDLCAAVEQCCREGVRERVDVLLARQEGELRRVREALLQRVSFAPGTEAGA